MGKKAKRMNKDSAAPKRKGSTSGSRFHFLSLTKGFAKPLYLSKEKKDEVKAVKELGAVRMIVGILAFVLLAIGIYWAFVSMIFPSFQKQQIPASSSSEEESGDSPPAEEAFLPQSYDSETGLPIYDDVFNLFVINSNSPVEKDFQVDTAGYEGIQVDKRILPALRMLVSEAEKSGIDLTFSQGLVNYETQETLYEARVQELIQKGNYTSIMARAEAKKTVAFPGEADEEVGMSVCLQEEQASFEGSKAYNWLNRNAAEYGFVFRYPKDKSQYTGADTDYRVLRYVGRENALKMRQLSMCLEEYIDYSLSK